MPQQASTLPIRAGIVRARGVQPVPVQASATLGAGAPLLVWGNRVETRTAVASLTSQVANLTTLEITLYLKPAVPITQPLAMPYKLLLVSLLGDSESLESKVWAPPSPPSSAPPSVPLGRGESQHAPPPLSTVHARPAAEKQKPR